MLDLKDMGVRELNAEEMKKIDGGKSWVDVLWMFAEDMVNGYVNACEATQKWAVNNPSYTGGRSFNR